MPNDLTVTQKDTGLMTPPEMVLSEAKIAAKALTDVISKKTNPVMMNGEQYLEFDDWQTVGQFYGYTVKTGDAVPVEVDGVKGAKAHADLVNFRTGEIVGGAEAYCMRDEPKWSTRAKYEWQGEGKDRRRVKIDDEPVPWFQLASMAQTRAGSKALRNRLAWVVVLAGYKPTPAEEIQDMASEAVQERRTVDKSAHYCKTHDVNFFKKGKMKGYAHPVEGTDKWCNEDEAEGELMPPDTRQDEQQGQEKPSPVDQQWLDETLAIIGWKEATAINYLRTVLKTVVSKTLADSLKGLPEDKLKTFVAKLQEMREAAGKG